jgi:medium-chain acyl-[acyl-carrier-protein] hydrolase
MSSIKLFCFPYAGGSSIIYNKWKHYLDPRIEIIPVELAGRGKRIQETLYKDVPDAIDDVYNIVSKELKGSSYALFGHSMGGMISYKLSQKLRENKYPDPVHIFFSGRSAPHVKRENETKYHLLEGDDFKKEVSSLGGTPPDFFDHPELLEVFLPILKNDFKLAETDNHIGEIHPLDCPISIFLGKDEDLISDQCDGWKKHTKKICTIHYFEGGHFFINTETVQIAKLINNTLFGDVYL